MATLDAGPRPRDTLPSINHLDLDKLRSEKNDLSRFSMANGLSISTAPLTSPTVSMYSAPPPPYSCAPSTAGSASGLSGYISPPESTTRRSTRDEKDSPGIRKSLPSIHEALGEKSLSFSAPVPSSSQHQPLPTPSTAVAPSFSEGPKGPVNPFSQSSGGPPVLRDVFSGNQKNTSGPGELHTAKTSFPPVTSSDPRQSVSQHFGYPGSPRSQPPPSFRSSSLTNTTFANPNEPPPTRSPQGYEPPRPTFTAPQYGNQNTSNFSQPPEPFQQFPQGPKPDDQRAPYPRSGSDPQYSDTVKRHLEVFDAELGLNEISEASARTLDFARLWGQRYHQGSRSGYYHDSLPGLAEVDDVLRQSHRIYENLAHLREVVIAQQTALSEQRARLARGSQMEEEYRGIPEDYKIGGFQGAERKRRGKAAPPGRCHSCNRAETPEWRRGPDGARTLCNACGLHYAKLTRKMGVNKAAALTGSNIRPKHLDVTRP